MSVKMKTRIRCVVDIPVDAWSPKTTFEELAETVKKEGRNILEKAIREIGGSVFGEPKSVFVIIEEE